MYFLHTDVDIIYGMVLIYRYFRVLDMTFSLALVLALLGVLDGVLLVDIDRLGVLL